MNLQFAIPLSYLSTLVKVLKENLQGVAIQQEMATQTSAETLNYRALYCIALYRALGNDQEVIELLKDLEGAYLYFILGWICVF